MNHTCWIFDLDGTLANPEHRLHHIQSKPKNWPAFNAGILEDEVIPQTLQLLRVMYTMGKHIVLCSGRNEDSRTLTKKWLEVNAVPYHELYMRKIKDFRPDYIVKSELLDQMLADGWTPQAVVDDRMSVCRMWHDRGIYVFCVNQGFNEF